MSNPSPPADPPAARGALLHKEGPQIPGLVLALLAVVCIETVVMPFFLPSLAIPIVLFGLLLIISVLSGFRHSTLRLFEAELVAGQRSIAVAELDPSFSVRRAADVFDEPSLELLTYAIPNEPNQERLETSPGNAVDFLGPGDMPEDLAVVRRRESDQLLLINVRRFDSFAGHLRSKLDSSEVLDVLPKLTLHEVDTPEP